MDLFSKIKNKIDKNTTVNNSDTFSSEDSILSEDELSYISGGISLTPEEFDNQINIVKNIINLNKR